MATLHSVKLNPYDSTELDKVSYADGDLVFDNTNGTVRVMDGITPGGHQLLRADFTNLTGVSRIVVSDTRPSTGLFSGSLWFNSANGSLYVYYSDANGSRWIQPMNPVYGSGGGGSGGGSGGGNDITLASTAANAQAADGAGIIINGANASILYNASTDAFVINKNITTKYYDIKNYVMWKYYFS